MSCTLPLAVKKGTLLGCSYQRYIFLHTRMFNFRVLLPKLSEKYCLYPIYIPRQVAFPC